MTDAPMEADFSALTSEADEWDVTSEALATAAATVSGLTLSFAQFSALASQFTSVETAYADARQHVEDVLLAGQAETKKLADALRQVKEDFLSTDEAIRAEIASLWTPE